jgi:hypothetical protein
MGASQVLRADVLLVAHVMSSVDPQTSRPFDDHGAAYWLHKAAEVVRTSPYPQFSQCRAVYMFAFEGLFRLSAFRAAVDVLQMLLDHLERKYGPNQPDSAPVWTRIAMVQSRRGKALEALEATRGAIRVLRKTARAGDIALPSSLSSAGMICSQLKQYKEAAEYFSEAREHIRLSQSDAVRGLARMDLKIGETFRRARDLESAETAFQSAYRILVDHLGAGHPATRLALSRLQYVQRLMQEDDSDDSGGTTSSGDGSSSEDGSESDESEADGSGSSSWESGSSDDSGSASTASPRGRDELDSEFMRALGQQDEPEKTSSGADDGPLRFQNGRPVTGGVSDLAAAFERVGQASAATSGRGGRSRAVDDEFDDAEEDSEGLSDMEDEGGWGTGPSPGQRSRGGGGGLGEIEDLEGGGLADASWEGGGFGPGGMDDDGGPLTGGGGGGFGPGGMDDDGPMNSFGSEHRGSVRGGGNRGTGSAGPESVREGSGRRRVPRFSSSSSTEGKEGAEEGGMGWGFDRGGGLGSDMGGFGSVRSETSGVGGGGNGGNGGGTGGGMGFGLDDAFGGMGDEGSAFGGGMGGFDDEDDAQSRGASESALRVSAKVRFAEDVESPSATAGDAVFTPHTRALDADIAHSAFEAATADGIGDVFGDDDQDQDQDQGVYVEGASRTPARFSRGHFSGTPGGAIALESIPMDSEGLTEFPNLAIMDEDEILGWSLRFDTPAEALGALKHVAEELSVSIENLADLATKRRRKAGETDDDVEDGAQEIASRMRENLALAIDSLSHQASATSSDVVRMRNVLFQVVSRIRGDLRFALEAAEITQEDIAALETLEAEADTESPQFGRRPSMAIRKGTQRSKSIRLLMTSSLLEPPPEESRPRGTSTASAGGGLPSSSPVAEEAQPSAIPLGPLVPLGDMDGALPQPGLVRAEDNPTNRRMKAVMLSEQDLAKVFSTKLFALGFCRRMASRKQFAKIRSKMAFLGGLAHFAIQRRRRKRAARVFTLGLLRRAMAVREIGRRVQRTFLVGVFAMHARWRRERQLKTKVFALGFSLMAQRVKHLRLCRTLLFASAAFVTIHRTNGRPTGYKPVKPPKKKVLTSNGMKQIHWDTLKDVKGTVWEDTRRMRNDRKVLKELFPDLKEVFTPKKVDRSSAAASEQKKPKVELINFVEDSKFKRALGIATGGFRRFGFDNLANAITDMDVAAFPAGLDDVEKLLMALVPDAMFARAREFTLEQVPRMDAPEQFVFAMKDVPLYRERLESMKLQQGLVESCHEVQADLELFEGACKELLENNLLKELLVGIILPFGELLHKGTKKGGARGIKMDQLGKLAESKTAKNAKHSALYYIVQALSEKRPHLLEFPKMFELSRKAMKSSMDKPTLAINEIRRSVKTLNTALDKATKLKDDFFIERTRPAAETVTRMFEAIEKRMEGLQQLYKDCLKYMGEEEDVKFESFFTGWIKFVDIFQETLSKYQADTEKAEKERRKAEKAAEAQALKEAKAREAQAAKETKRAARSK